MFTPKIIFSDEAISHLSAHVTRHDVTIWGSNNPHATISMSFVLNPNNKGSGLYLFAESTVTEAACLDMPKDLPIPILEETGHSDMLLQQRGAPSHFQTEIRNFVDPTFPGK